MSSFLLTRHGFVAETTRKFGELVELAEMRRANVVVLDGSESPADAARTAALIEARHPRVGVLLVADDIETGYALRFRPVSKWASFEKIVSEVERLYARTGIRRTRPAPLARAEVTRLQRH